ncbi:MAG: phage baseplate protein [Cetobacterium sp.]
MAKAFLQGTSGSESAGGTGGVSTITLTTSHLPAHNHIGSVTIASAGDHRHQVDSHTHTQPIHKHFGFRGVNVTAIAGGGNRLSATNYVASSAYTGGWGESTVLHPHSSEANVGLTSGAGAENTGGSAPNTNTTGSHGHSGTLSINNTGSGSSFSIIPPYLRVNIWKRLT